MEPIFQKGDILIYEKIWNKEKEKIDLNSIIVFKNHNRLISHRIVKIIKNNYFITKGDNNKNIDYEIVHINDILGIYKFHFKYIGYLSIWLHNIF